jgi:SAM-dependent methyltransferase
MIEGSPLAVKHALELKWHEEHAHEGEDARISTYKKLVLQRVRDRQWVMLGDLTGKRALDVGCGVGRETVELARRGARVVAVDLSPTLVSAARRRSTEAGVADHVEFRVSAAEELASDGEQFDVVLGNGVLHHFDIPAFKATLIQLMSEGAVAQFAEPLAHNPLMRLYRRLTPHLHSPTEQPLTEKDIEGFARGFREVSVEYFNLVGLLLLPAPYVVGRHVSGAFLSVALRCDMALFRIQPSLQRFCQYVIIQVRAPA